jgi:hypothetical protein
VAAKAATVLLPLELEIRNWPAEFRAIIWDAVALTAAQHRSDANAEHTANKGA